MTTDRQSPKKIGKKPWPTKMAMEQVYSDKLWGGPQYDYYSGSGSHQPELVLPYIEVVREFLNSFEHPLSVADLGCGDFNVGKALVEHTSSYTAVDIVEDLIERNKKLFQADHLSFHCLDIANDSLPHADCALLRQVLQHLSNAEVQSIVEKLTRYKYVILTEHVPHGDFDPNLDIISGQGIRLKKQSGIDLLAPPFCFKAKSAEHILSLDLGKQGGLIVTTLFSAEPQLFNPHE
jgi:SAM-dependent methyltransferase